MAPDKAERQPPGTLAHVSGFGVLALVAGDNRVEVKASQVLGSELSAMGEARVETDATDWEGLQTAAGRVPPSSEPGASIESGGSDPVISVVAWIVPLLLVGVLAAVAAGLVSRRRQ
jgi:hypothetical protein